MEAVNLAPVTVFSIGSLNITTTLILQFFITALILSAFLITGRKWQKRPKKFQLLMEAILEFMFAQIDKLSGDRRKTVKIFPLIFSLFIFVLCSNLFTMLPGLGAFSVMTAAGTSTTLFRSTLADYSAVLVLTLITVTVAQFAFIFTQGLGKYLKQFFDFSNPINFFLGLMNLIGELAKILSLSFRLFGNVFAGEVLLTIITALIPFVVPLPFYALSLFSSVIQAYVFAVLSAVFISTNMDLKEELPTEIVTSKK